MINKYKKVNGTSCHKETSQEVINILEQTRLSCKRIRLWLGEDGKSWNEENDIIGYIGRSTGEYKIPLLIKNSRSLGGGGLLDHCIIKISDCMTKKVLYQHPKFEQDYFEADDSLVYQCSKKGLRNNAQIYANCKDWKQAKKLAQFMNGQRNSK